MRCLRTIDLQGFQSASSCAILYRLGISILDIAICHLTRTNQGISPPQYFGSLREGVLPRKTVATSATLHQTHFSGSLAKLPSSSMDTDTIFVFAFLVSLLVRIFSKRTEADFSSTSWGTIRPRIAICKTACLNPSTSSGTRLNSAQLSRTKAQAVSSSVSLVAFIRASRAETRRPWRRVLRFCWAASRVSHRVINSSTLATIRFCSAKSGMGKPGFLTTPVAQR
jgi:hypothetical protein